jgi:hypothetical protein
MRASRPADEKTTLGTRARVIAVAAIPQARRASTNAVNGVRQGVEGARGWAAPRLDQAADAFMVAVAPKVTSTLHSTASKVAPVPAGKTGIRRLLDWRLLLGIGAGLAAAGAAAAMTMRKRYQVATMAASEDAEMTDSPGEEAAAEAEADNLPRYDANGRVTTRH